ncbi:hypothetical protein I5Q34_01050 [Streptomyces sp. AV19]|uniref:hypothetical protein n=1 Tax=Streptomyces sp. AV19 TaxID=2793068 RepID=UPI0018FE3D7B|nr:hypothetical protein [Streptomyces sp. AV19]MBH1932893.1 hypothetical protein [Streptomyces sp. AV19]MDG4531571.1 hypothetical protein [Streptomyces sp. AV19]
MPQHRRTTAAGLMTLLLLMVTAVLGLSGTGPAAPATTASATATAARSLPDHRPDDGAYAVVPHAGSRDDNGGSCRPLDVPFKGTEAVVAHGHTDPLLAAGAARSPLPRAPHQRLGVPRAPPTTAAGAAELLPVLRI